MQRRLHIGTRGSPLALAQGEEFRRALATAQGWDAAALQEHCELITIKTTGDAAPTIPIEKLGNKGVFIKELETALLSNHIDVAVHSAKDMLPLMPQGLVLATTLKRGDPRDAFILHKAKRFEDLPKGARFGTSSPRRQAQVLARRPDLCMSPIRGNVDTRLTKVQNGEIDATLLAAAGLTRLGRLTEATDIRPTSDFLPALCQGIIGLQCRADDQHTQDLLAHLNHAPTFLCTLIERAFLARLSASCTTAVAGLATIDDKNKVDFKAELFHPGGEKYYKIGRTKNIQMDDHKQAALFGQEAAQDLMSQAAADGFTID